MKAQEGRKKIAPGKSAQRAPPGVHIKKTPLTFLLRRASTASISVCLERENSDASVLNSSLCVLCAFCVLCVFALIFPLKKITSKRPQPGKPIPRIHVFFDHIKREIVKSAEAPNRNRQQHPHFQSRMFEHNQRRRQHANQQKQNSFQFNPPRIGQVFHLTRLVTTDAREVTNFHSPSHSGAN